MTLLAAAAGTIARIATPIQDYTRSWMLAPRTNAHGVSLGFATGAQFWVVGRAGVLDECTAENAFAAIAFEPLDAIERAWEAIPAGLSPRDVAVAYCRQLTQWGEQAWTGTDREALEVVDELGRRVADAAPSNLGALFAGWRSLPRPASLPARAALTVHVLRELRGAAHIAAIARCGLTPLDAILAATHAPPRTGPAYAERLGFRPPFRDPSEVRPQREEAERLTESTMVPYFASLAVEELTCLEEAITVVCDEGLAWGAATGRAFSPAPAPRC